LIHSSYRERKRKPKFQKSKESILPTADWKLNNT